MCNKDVNTSGTMVRHCFLFTRYIADLKTGEGTARFVYMYTLT